MSFSKYIPAPVIDQITDGVRVVVRMIIDRCRSDKLSDEDHITGALTTLLEHHLEELSIEGIKIETKSFTLKEETATGADLGILLNVGIGSYRLSKAVIAQAKKCECKYNKRFYDGNVRKNLLKQLENMLRISPASFVLIYTRNYRCGIQVLPAADVLALDDSISCSEMNKLNSFAFPILFRYLLRCEIGDVKIARNFFGLEAIKRFAMEYRIRHSLLLKLTGWEKSTYDFFGSF
ncbi:TPA: hypothetical protein EYP70_02070 [Candidatus Bathyarchaeota archaeon]|nr:hypothetical protein [Candidatus Bathyarchaeota archaeon]